MARFKKNEPEWVKVENELDLLNFSDWYAFIFLHDAQLLPYKDGNSWCILVGEDLQSGIAGFGDSLNEALSDFLKNVKEPLPFINYLQQKQSTNTDNFYSELVNFLIKNDIQEDKAKFLANRIADKYGSKRYIDGLCDGLDVNKQEQPEMDLEKFTEKIKTFQGRYKHPEIVSIKGAMAFMARMFYQYPNTAREWYDNLPKATMDNARKEE